jgi:glyoxylase-like metal-dependent hydrolase (beta-lactamase superfamily II)
VLPTGDPLTWSPLASTMVFGETDAVLVDPPFTQERTVRVGGWIERSGKGLAHIYVTHGHGDHWFGAPLLVERFPGTTVYATGTETLKTGVWQLDKRPKHEMHSATMRFAENRYYDN